ncbi:hypothetical protein FDK38_003721 [Candidozyma auris]|nr:hypothetical protein FDK38_003721 [[Candida] auris]
MPTEVHKLRHDLYQAAILLDDLCLYNAAKWATEALVGLASTEEEFEYTHPTLSTQQKQDRFQFMLAKNYFNNKEFSRAAYTLRNCLSGDALFLRLYSMFISIDKKATEENDGSVNSFHKQSMLKAQESFSDESDQEHRQETLEELNSTLGKIVAKVDSYHEKVGEENAHLHFLAGLTYNKKKKHQLAQQSLFSSVKLFPYNWSCWQELIATFSTFEEAHKFVTHVKKKEPTLAGHVMFTLFEVVLLQEFYQQSAMFTEKFTSLVELFPDFVFLKIQKFLVAYHGLDYFQAEQMFDEILAKDPVRLDDLDTYSNMLYVMENKSKLAYLAHHATQIDNYRSETCCIVANYHSMKGEHEKAVMYFRRALLLNKLCLSAWTLMGHEFVELKNSHAAIESYRRAVDINAKDFRAWYGLGQAYEVLDMHLYALYYYQRATNLQPMDKRMWQAIGNCYEKIDKLEEAVRSFEKALSIDSLNEINTEEGEPQVSVEPHICYKLATISEKLGRSKETYKYMRMCLEQEFDWGLSDETSKARLWLARHALESHRYNEAYDLARESNFDNAHDVEEARAIAKDARERMTY